MDNPERTKVYTVLVLATILVIPTYLNYHPHPLNYNNLAFAAQGSEGDNDNLSKHVAGRLLIKFNDKVSNDTFKQHQIIWQNGAEVIEEIPHIGVKILKVPENSIDKIQSGFRTNENVEFVEKDLLFEPESTTTISSDSQIIPNDPSFDNQWQLSKIDAPHAWNISIGSNSIIAILDSGVEPTHPDLVDKLLPGYNFYDNNNNSTDIACKHGTVVAGIAAGTTNNGIGVASVAWNSKILPLRVTDADCWGSISAMSKAIIYASDNGAKVANLSFKIPNPSLSSSLMDAYKYMYGQGGFVVIAAGNDGSYLDIPDTPEVIHVGSTESRDYVTNFSNYGPFIDFVAPGQAIYTSIWSGQYDYVSGTSFSTPVVSGVLALMFAANPGATSQQVYDALKQSAADIVYRDDGYNIMQIPSGKDYYSGWGRVDAYGALKQIVGLTTISQDTIPPIVNTQSSMTVEASGASGSIVYYASATASDNIGIVRGPDCIPSSGSIFPLGTTTVLCLASDAAGNTGSASFSVSVLDTAAPIVKVPSDITITVPGGSTGTTVTFTASASDLVDGSITPACSPGSGSQFPLGDTLVTCTATDNHGNKASAAFHIMVSTQISSPNMSSSETTPPLVAISSPTSGSSVRGTVTITIFASDSSGINKVEVYIDGKLKGTLSSSPYDFSWNTKKIKDGQHTIAAIAYDLYGNSASSTIAIQVSNRG